MEGEHLCNVSKCFRNFVASSHRSEILLELAQLTAQELAGDSQRYLEFCPDTIWETR